MGSENFDFIFNCGYTKPTALATISDKDDIIRTVWLHFILFRPHAELAQLRKGMYQTLQFEILSISYPGEVKAVLAGSAVFDVTPKYLRESFMPCYSPNGSNKRTKEEAIVYHWFEYISECATGGDVSLREILRFFSGSAKMPAIGLDGVPTICFCDKEGLPYSSTCDFSITFPRSLGLLSFEQFKLKMNFCILGSYGFGNV